MRLPFKGNFRISQEFSKNPDMYKKFGFLGHNGIDYATPSGTPILAPHNGKVIESAFDANGYGYYIKIENDKEGSVLAHNKEILVKVGDTVEEGQKIAISDNTGNSTGPHLHWGYYTKPRNRQNGYGGFIDQQPLLNTQPMPSEMYGTPLQYDLNNKESMKVIIDSFNDFMTPGKFMKVADSETLFNQLKSEYETKLQNASTQVSNLSSSIMGFAVLLGLAKEANPDEILKAIKALQDSVNSSQEGTGTPAGTLPEVLTLNGDQWGLSKVTFGDGKLSGNYQRL